MKKKVSQKKNKTQPPVTVQNFPIVGIGASAGGLEAFRKLLAAIPEISGMAYVLVQHLDPSHESILPEILQRETKIPVHEITDEIHLAPDHIYVIPSNKILTSTDGILQLTPRSEKINLCIDVFFITLADVHKECAIGVILSGTGSDGTLGLKAIKDNGGISIVQSIESAAYNSMPQSAINAEVVDFILAPEKIPAKLLQIKNSFNENNFFTDDQQLPKNEEDLFKQILLLLKQRSGVDFTYYKKPTFHRRIARRITIAKKKNLADYLKFLLTNKTEQDLLFQDVLIPVTSFFRDPKTFQTLTDTIFPTLFKNKARDEPIRVWIAGCSTGEEAYSIAICLHEFLGEKLSNKKIQIFATDISEKVIKKARAAIYAKAEVEILSASQIKNYFVINNGSYEVSKFIRDMCVFAPHNFLKDPPFAKMDLITCRNVLIYMDTFLHKKAFNTFHYALKENGFLLLGKSETTGASSDLFLQVEKHEKIYSRKPFLGRFMHFATERKEEYFVSKNKTVTKNETTNLDFRKSAEEIMILKSPASVIVNEAMDIVHIHGDITPFLQVPQGKPSHNLIKMAREGLAFELRNSIHKATKEHNAVIKEDIIIKSNEKQYLVTIEIIPLTDTIEPHYLICFEKKAIPIVKEEKKYSSGKIIETQKQNQHLEKELSQTREDMRSITEDMEAANEELQSANEELQSSNEEMQSLNEELETSKEELQSTNEELLIVNQELLDKQEQLNASNSEQVKARKLIEASEKEQKKLANQLRLATDSAKVGIWTLDIASSKLEWSNIHKKMWGYDENREDLTYKDWYKVILPEYKELASQKVQDAMINHSIYELDYKISRANDGVHVWIKSTGQYYYDKFGVAHTMTGVSIDISEQKEIENKIAESEKQFEIFANSIQNLAWIANREGYIYWYNQRWYEYTGTILKEMEGSGWEKVHHPDHIEKVSEFVKEAWKSDKAFELTFPLRKYDGTYHWFLTRVYPIKDVNGNVERWIGTNTDITQQKSFTEELEVKIKERTNELQIQNETFKLAEKVAKFGSYKWNIATGSIICSENLFRLLDCEPQEFVPTLEMFLSFIHPDDLQEAIKNGEETMQTGNLVETPYRIISKLGKLKHFRSSGSFSKENNDTVLIGTVQDISKDIEAEEELLKKNHHLEVTNAQLASFTYAASHDLQEPLRKIQSFSKRIIEIEKFSVQTQDYFNRIIAAGERMQNLILSLLDFSRTDIVDLNFTSCNLNLIVEETISDLSIVILEKKAIIDYENLPTLKGLPIQLCQLFTNLIDNAIKYSRPQIKPHIKITSARIHGHQIEHPLANKQKEYESVKITDNGIGFGNEHSTKIFELFQRLHAKNEYSGTGVGLAIVKKILTNHNGFIVAEGIPNVGSTFTFYIPVS